MTNNNDLIRKKWRLIASQFRAEYGENSHRQWMGDLVPLHIDNDDLVLLAPNKQAINFITKQYGSWLNNKWRSENKNKGAVQIIVKMAKSSDQQLPDSSDINQNKETKKQSEKKWGQSFNNQYLFNNFISGECNQIAYAMALKLSESKKEKDFSSLFIHGDVGCGKTHLLNAISNQILQDNPEAKVQIITAKDFVEKYVETIMQKTFDFKMQFRDTECVLIDDLHFIIGKIASITILEEIFDFIVDNGKKIAFASTESPQKLDKLGERLISRIQGGMVSQIHELDFETRFKLFEFKAQNKNMSIPSRILELITERTQGRCGRDCDGILTRLLYFTGRENFHITEIIGEKFVASQLPQNAIINRAQPKIEEIQRLTAQRFNVTQKELVSKMRPANLAYPRQVAMYLSRKLTKHSYTFLAQKFERDHTTILYALNKIEKMMATDPQTLEDIEALKRSILGA